MSGVTYRLIQSGDQAYIVRGTKRVGTITKVNGKWHGRLWIKDGNAITSSGDDLVAVFNSIIDKRIA